MAHLGGDSNYASDAVSRALWDRLDALARQLRLRLTRLPLCGEATRIFDECLTFCRKARAGPPREPKRGTLGALTSSADPLAFERLGGPWRSLVIRATAPDACGPDYVYGGRGGNDHAARQGHARWGNYARKTPIRNDLERQQAIDAFRDFALGDSSYVAAVRRELRGKRLGCFCCPRDCLSLIHI